jgi:hypothetical protein
LCFRTWILKDKIWRLAVALSVWDISRWSSGNKPIVISTSKVVDVLSSFPPDKCHSAPEQRVFKQKQDTAICVLFYAHYCW